MRQSESYPMSLHALNRMKSDLRLLMLQRWNSFCVSPCLKQVESWPVTLHVWGWNLTHVSSCFEQAENYTVSFHASLCLSMRQSESYPMCFPCVSLKGYPMSLWTLSLHDVSFQNYPVPFFVSSKGWNLTCASSCFKGGSHSVCLHALNRLKVDLWLFMYEAEIWPMSLHALNRLKITLCLSMRQSENYPVPFHASVWKLPDVSSCFEQDEIWPAPPHASKVEVILCVSMP